MAGTGTVGSGSGRRFAVDATGVCCVLSALGSLSPTLVAVGAAEEAWMHFSADYATACACLA